MKSIWARLFIIITIFLVQINAKEQVLNIDFTPLPKNIKKVYGSAPPITFMLYVIDESSLVGVSFPQINQGNKDGEKFLSKDFMKLPVLGGWHGDKLPNLEAIIKANPELIIVWDTPLLMGKSMKDIEKMNIPFLKINLDSSRNYPQNFRILGEVLDRKDRANKLADYAEKELKELDDFIESLGDAPRTKVYYAQGPTGLQTECDSSFHSEPLVLAGGNVVHKCSQTTIVGMPTISFEELMVYDPDIIISQNEEFFQNIFNDLKWKTLRAVKNKNVFLAPKTPFNWIDRPPSFMRILGVHWLASRMYPKSYPYDLEKKIIDFYELFFGKTLTKEEIDYYFKDY